MSATDDRGWNPACGAPQQCLLTDPKTGVQAPAAAFATLTLRHGRWGDPIVWCPDNAAPAPTVADIRAQAIRLLPAIRIGSAWTTTTLVNAETILWADTPPQRNLGPVTLLGHHIGIRIHLHHATWNFGDTTTDTTTTPGKPYDPTDDPCHTPQCPHYYGHTYTHTGTATITLTLTITWTAQYQLGPTTTTWTNLQPAITGPASTHTITIEQARSYLVPDH